MKRKSIIAIIISFAFVSMAVGVIATDTLPITWNGTGTATINNAGPSLTGIAINNGAGWVTDLDVNAPYLFYVNVSDVNTIDDMKSISVQILVNGYSGYDNPIYYYGLTYTETTVHDGVIDGTWTQVLPTAGVYLNTASCVKPTIPTSQNGSYIFSLTMPKNALAGAWVYNAQIYDSVGATASKGPKAFNVYKYLEMTYDTGSGSQNFAWTGFPGTQNAVDTFAVTVTANTPYTLSAAYGNRFYNASTSTVWASEPSLEIKYDSGAKVPVTNATASFTPWSSFSGLALAQTSTHTIYLDYETVLPALTYTGVTIYIRASV